MIGGIQVVPERAEDTTAQVILCDTSGSMIGRRIERLKEQLGAILKDSPARLAAFSTGFAWIESVDRLPAPDGSTRLAEALEQVAKAWPTSVLVISDGEPNDPDAAIAAASLIPGVIHTLFVGDDDKRGVAFMSRLARAGGGNFAHRSLDRNVQIGDAVRSMLALDAPPMPMGG